MYILLWLAGLPVKIMDSCWPPWINSSLEIRQRQTSTYCVFGGFSQLPKKNFSNDKKGNFGGFSQRKNWSIWEPCMTAPFPGLELLFIVLMVPFICVVILHICFCEHVSIHDPDTNTTIHQDKPGISTHYKIPRRPFKALFSLRETCQ